MVSVYDGIAWDGPGKVIYQKGNAVFIHCNEDVKKAAACKVKPYELKGRKKESKEEKRDENDWNKNFENCRFRKICRFSP